MKNLTKQSNTGLITYMKSINQELIPNKHILSFGYWENMELEKLLLSVTRGIATDEQKKECYLQFSNELIKNEDTLNDIYFKNDNTFELWAEGKLIGLCQYTAIARDWISDAAEDGVMPEAKNEDTLFIFSELEAVFILKNYRDKDLVRYFAGVIREEQFKQLLGLITYQNNLAFKTINNHFFSEYITPYDEEFHYLLSVDDISEYAKSLLKNMGFTYNATFDGDY